MAFTLEHTFVVKAPPDKVFAYLTDVYRVAPALPGAAITEKSVDGSYTGTITVKVGPVSARYRGKVHFDALDAAARTVQIVASGQETTGRGGADMRMQSRLIETAPGETQVIVSSEVNVTGILAQFGRGMIQDVSNQIFQRFSEAVRRELENDEAAAAPPAPATPAPLAEAAAPTLTVTTAATATAPTATAPVPPPPAATASVPSPSLASAATGAPVAAALAARARASRAPAAVSPPINIAALGSKALGRAAARNLTRPAIWLTLVVVVLLSYWLLDR